MKLNEREWWRRECKRLYFFETVVLSTVWKEKFHDFGPLQKEICDFLDIGLTPSTRKLVSADRHSYKSTCLLGEYLWLFCWYRVKNEAVTMEYNTATKDNAEMFMADFWFTLNECDLLHQIFGDVLPPSERQYTKRTKGRVQAGEVLFDVGSLEEQQVMRHYKIIGNDDLENDINSRTEAARELVKTKWKMQKSILSKSSIKKTGLEIDMGTPYHYQGLIWDLIKRKKNYDKLIRACIEGWPNISISDIKNRTKPITDPKNKTYEDLLETLDDQGAHIFTSQYLLLPLSEEGSLCPPEWLKYYDNPPDTYYRTMVWDIGGSDPKEHDATGITVVDTDLDGIMYVRLAEEIWLTPSDVMKTMNQYIELWKPDDVRVEKEKYGITVADFYERDFPLHNIGFLSHKKEDNRFRIWALRPYLQKGKIRIKQDMHDLEDYLLQYPQVKHDDMLTSLAYHLDIRMLPDQKHESEFNPAIDKSFDTEFDKFMARRDNAEKDKISVNDSMY